MFTMTARDFNQQVGRAQRVADGEPVMVTRHGEPAYVLLSITEYERLQGGDAVRDTRTLLDILAPADADIDHRDEFGRIMDEIVADRKRDIGRPPLEF